MSGPQGNNPLSVLAKEDETITSTSSYVTRFNIDLEGYADGVIVIRNDSGTICKGGHNTMKVFKLGLPKNETLEEYEKAMDEITEWCLEEWDEEWNGIL